MQALLRGPADSGCQKIPRDPCRHAVGREEEVLRFGWGRTGVHEAVIEPIKNWQVEFEPTMDNVSWLLENGAQVAVAGRSLTGEDRAKVMMGYSQLLAKRGMVLSKENLVVFPEMDPKGDVPEITTACWDILNKSPDDMMCSSSRMVVKRKGESRAKVLACTLLAYDKQFELGEELRTSEKKVQLNHRFCAQFCVLGGSSCS